LAPQFSCASVHPLPSLPPSVPGVPSAAKQQRVGAGGGQRQHKAPASQPASQEQGAAAAPSERRREWIQSTTAASPHVHSLASSSPPATCPSHTTFPSLHSPSLPHSSVISPLFLLYYSLPPFHTSPPHLPQWKGYKPPSLASLLGL
jgi:hypothetical protein